MKKAFLADHCHRSSALYDVFGFTQWVLHNNGEGLTWKPPSATHLRSWVPMTMTYEDVDLVMPQMLLALAEKHGLAERVDTLQNIDRMTHTVLFHPTVGPHLVSKNIRLGIECDSLPKHVAVLLPPPEEAGRLVISHEDWENVPGSIKTRPRRARDVALDYGLMLLSLPRAVCLDHTKFVDLRGTT